MGLNPGGSGKVDINSDLVRKRWAMEGLVKKAHVSFWQPYKGATSDSIIYTEKNISASAGHTVVFDYDGFLKGKAIKGTNTAKGKGELKLKFSDKITVSDYRWVVDNGTKFDGVNIGDLSINEHSDSINKLADLYYRNTDQAIFDVAQQANGTAADSGFRIEIPTGFDFDAILDIEEKVKTGTGYSSTAGGMTTRMPLRPYILRSGEPVWLYIIDTPTKVAMLKSTGAQALIGQADLRGDENRLFKGILGKIGNFLIIEGPTFFGSTTPGADIVDANGYYAFENTSVELSGLRQYDATNDAWTGEEGFDLASTGLTSRGLVMGQNAIQFAIGKAPDYQWEPTDFKKFSESCLEFWGAVKATELLAENNDYKAAKVANYKFGVIAVDYKIR